MKRMAPAPRLYYCSCSLHQRFTLSLKRTVICILANNNFLRFLQLVQLRTALFLWWLLLAQVSMGAQLAQQRALQTILGVVWSKLRRKPQYYKIVPQCYKKYTKDSRTLPIHCKLNVHVHHSNIATGVYPLPLLLLILWSLNSLQKCSKTLPWTATAVTALLCLRPPSAWLSIAILTLGSKPMILSSTITSPLLFFISGLLT